MMIKKLVKCLGYELRFALDEILDNNINDDKKKKRNRRSRDSFKKKCAARLAVLAFRKVVGL